MFSNVLYRLSLLALFLNANSNTATARSIDVGEVEAILSSKTSVDYGRSAPIKYLRTPVTKRSLNRTRMNRIPRTLPVLDTVLQPLSANVQVDICIDLSVRVLGVLSLNVFATANLQASINKNGISVQELTTVQAYLAAQLAASARAASTSWECQQACTSGICTSQTWNQKTKTCSLIPQQLTSKSSVLAKLIAQLGPSDPQYCQLCPNRCNTAPSAAPKKPASAPVGYCPTGFNACPINSKSPSLGFECLNVQQELDSCGGCASTGEGVNCNNLPGFKRAGCNAGHCLAFECKAGYRLTAASTCVAA